MNNFGKNSLFEIISIITALNSVRKDLAYETLPIEKQNPSGAGIRRCAERLLEIIDANPIAEAAIEFQMQQLLERVRKRFSLKKEP